MTNPLSLLAPLASADPVQAPAPAEDPALFVAALVAAFQTAMVPLPATVQVVTSTDPTGEPPADPEPGEDTPGGDSDTASPAPANPATSGPLAMEPRPGGTIVQEARSAVAQARVHADGSVPPGPAPVQRSSDPEADEAAGVFGAPADTLTAAPSTPVKGREAERAGAELVVPPSGDTSSTKESESRPGIERPADRVPISHSTTAEAVVTDAGFVQAVGELLGDAELTSIRVMTGQPVARTTAMLGGSPIEPTPAIAGTATRAVPPGAADLIRAGTSASEAFPISDANVLPGEQGPASHPRPVTERMNTDTGARSASRPPPEANLAPRPSPAASPPGSAPHSEFPQPIRGSAPGQATDRKLPASRQELPAQPIRSPGGQDLARDEVRLEAKAPSVESTVTSTVPPDSSAGLTRGESRADERAAGEARNLPEGKETRERPAGIADRITLQVADADGRATRIRVAVLGNQVRAVIQPHDGEAARHLERRMDELQQALVRQGFVDPKVTVQAAATTGEGIAPWGSTPAAGPTDPPSSRGTDPPPGDHRQGSGRREPGRDGDGHRHSQQQNRERDPEGRRR